MPAPNETRRAVLADAAVALLADEGAHGLTHRGVERRAGLPTGTASNYFATREALFAAAAERVLAQQRDAMASAERGAGPDQSSETGGPGAAPHTRLGALLTDALVRAATVDRDRHRALLELRLESARRPVLAARLDVAAAAMAQFTAEHHGRLDLAIPPGRVPALMAAFGGMVWMLVTQPGPPGAEQVRAAAGPMVEGLVRIALATDAQS